MGTTAEKLTYLNETKTKLKDMLNLGGASLTTEPFRQYVDTLKNRYLYFINNGTQEVWDNWEKVVGEGTTITLNNTEEAPMKIVLKGNTSQEGTPTPESPQDIHVVSGDNSIEVSNRDNTQSASYPISLGNIELCKIGDYQDSIVKDNGKWYLNKQIGKVIYTGASSENWTTGDYGTNSYKILLNNPANIKDVYMMISDIFRGVAYSERAVAGNNIVYYDLDNAYVRNTSYTSLADFKTMLGTNNMTLYYVLNTPTYTKIEGTLESQLNALSGAKSYTGQTNISQESNDLASLLNATALEEMS